MDINELKKLGNLRKYNEDDYVFYQGDEGDELYVVLTGKVGIYINSFEGSHIKVAEIGPGSFFGEMSVIDDQPRSASVVAEVDTLALAINKSNFQLFISKQPLLAYKIMKGLSIRIRNLNVELSTLRKGISIRCKDDSGSSKLNELSATNIPLKSPSLTKDIQKESWEDDLYPKGHKTYGILAPDTHEMYIFDKEARCPVCTRDFKIKVPRISKVKLDSTDKDLRKRYVDFEPFWYFVWVCPNCYYSSYYYDFKSIQDKCCKILPQETEIFKDKLKLEFTVPRTIDQVFVSYYLALFCAKVCKQSAYKLAKLYLHLSWLYKDASDEAMFEELSSLALNSMYEAFYNSNLDISLEEEQQCCLIMGELFLRKGDEKKAIECFHKSINRKGGVVLLNQQAQDRIIEIRSNAMKS